jgi:hypothetical protein
VTWYTRVPRVYWSCRRDLRGLHAVPVCRGSTLTRLVPPRGERIGCVERLKLVFASSSAMTLGSLALVKSVRDGGGFGPSSRSPMDDQGQATKAGFEEEILACPADAEPRQSFRHQLASRTHPILYMIGAGNPVALDRVNIDRHKLE